MVDGGWLWGVTPPYRGVELHTRVIGGAQAHLHIGTETPPW